MPFAFFGAIWGFLKGLSLGLAVLAACVLALVLLSGEGAPSRRAVTADKSPPAPAAPNDAVRVASGPAPTFATPAGPSVIGGADMTAPGAPAALSVHDYAAPAASSRVNAAALAAMGRADVGEGLTDAFASAPRPMALADAGSADFAATETRDSQMPGGAVASRPGASVALSRPTPTRLAALDDGLGARASGGAQALSAVAGADLPEQRVNAARVAGLPMMGAAPGSANASPGLAPAMQQMRVSALSPSAGAVPGMSPGAMQTPGIDAPRALAGGMAPAARIGGGAPNMPGGDGGFTGLGGGSAPVLRGGAQLSAPVGHMSAAPSPASAQRVASLSPAGGEIARVGAMPDLDGAIPLAAVTAGDAAEAQAPAAAGIDDTLLALRVQIRGQTGGVPMPLPRPARGEATPVERVDLASTPVTRAGDATPVTRIDTAAGRDALRRTIAATPVMRLDVPRTAPKMAAAEGPTAIAPVVLGPGRLDDRRASSLVAAISSRPGAGVSAPRIVAAPGLSLSGGRTDQRQRGGEVYGAGQSSAPRPNFGAAAPALGSAGGRLVDDAPLGIALSGGSGSPISGSRVGGAPLTMNSPRMASLSLDGAAGRASPFFSSSSDTAPPLMTDAAPQSATTPLLALFLRGVNPTLAADANGPLAPLIEAGVSITLISPQSYLPDADAAARLRALGIELVAEADDATDLAAIAALGAVAVVPTERGGRKMSMSSLRRFLSDARDNGLALFNGAPASGPEARMALNIGLNVIDSLQVVEIRSEANMGVLRAVLKGAAQSATQSGAAAIELWATPASIAEVAAWFAANRDGAANPASASMLLADRTPR